MAHPDFGRSVNPISTRGNKLCPPNYYWHTRIFRHSDGPVSYGQIDGEDFVNFCGFFRKKINFTYEDVLSIVDTSSHYYRK